MKKLFFFVLVLSKYFIFGSSDIYKIKKMTGYRFGSELDYFFDYENSYYDYCVFFDKIDRTERLNFDLYILDGSYYISDLDFWGYHHSSSYSIMTEDTISKYIDEFWYLDYDYNKRDHHFSFHDKAKINTYYYLAIHFSEEMQGTYQLKIYSEYGDISTLAAIFIILIILGVLIVLAACSMGVAKMMGRSPLDGLLCFFILCAICCCRSR